MLNAATASILHPSTIWKASCQQLERVPLAEGEHLRVRLIWHDTRNGLFYTAAMDYLVPSDRLPSLQPEDLYRHLGEGYVDGGAVDWHLLLQVWLPMSDSASLDDPSYYSGISLSAHDGFFGRLPLTYFANHGRWVKVEPPSVRGFNDQLMWEKDKEKLGFKKVGNLSVAQGVSADSTGTTHPEILKPRETIAD